MKFFTKIERKDSKMLMKPQKTPSSQSNSKGKEENNIEGITLSELKVFQIATVIKDNMVQP